mmetsp:Transcript_24412/g.81925  ORF Transcript_24412/g.81925 Transcript_24412/m.81925 type:complete len:323 (+) Transcript_24412:62-1030(+)
MAVAAMSASAILGRIVPAGEELSMAISTYIFRASGVAAASSAAPTGRAAFMPMAKAAAKVSGAAAKGSASGKAGGAAAVGAPAGKLRVLCLHGYTQNGEVFRSKTGSVRKAMKGCEFEFVDAPHSAAGAFPDSEAADYDAAGSSAEDGVGPRGWWHAGENAAWSPGQPWVRPAMASVCEGWSDSLDFVRHEVSSRGPFHGVFAFSQSCAVASALLREAADGSLPALVGVRFAVLVGGFLPRDAAVVSHMRGGGTPLRVHTLHVTGTEDTLVPRPRSEELSELFDSSQSSWLEHSGRHGVPTGTGSFRDALRKLLIDASEQTP